MWGFAGLITAFILLASVLLWLFIYSPKIKIVFKIILVPVLLWYGIVLYYTPLNLMGHPVEMSPPEGAYFLAIQIKEPKAATATDLADPGGIYITAIVYDEDGMVNKNFMLNPKSAFAYRTTNEPRLYKIPYSREDHKAIIKAQREAHEKGRGTQMRMGKKTDQKGEGGDKSKAKLTIEITNPITGLRK